MKSIVLILTVIVSISGLFSGCTALRISPAAMVEPSPFVEGPDGSYYLYTEAQIHRKQGDLEGAIRYLREAISADEESIFLKRELASAYLDGKDTANALEMLERILGEKPDDVETLVLYGRLNLNLKRMEPAKAAFEKVLSGDPKKEAIYTTLGRIYMTGSDLSNAYRVFKQLVDHFPASFVGHFYLGKIYALQGKPKLAEQSFDKTLALEPRLVEPRFELIELLRRERDDGRKEPEKTERIISLYQELLKEHPRNIRAGLELGLFYHEIERTGDAERILSDMGRRSGSEKAVLSTIIRHYFEDKKYDAIRILLKYMLIGAPENSDLFYLSGLTYNELKEQEKAITQFGKVKADSRFYENAVVNTTLILQERKELEKAIAYLEEVIAKVPGNAEFMLFLGTLFEEKGEFGKAVDVLERGLIVDAENHKIHFRLGVVYDKWGRKEDCITAMKTVIRLDPEHANALNYLGYTYADLGKNLDEAEELIKRALAKKPDDGYITDSLGWVFYKKGMFEKALEYIQKAVSLVPDDPTILEHLGDVYFNLENREKALEFYNRSLENQKENREGIEKKIKEITGAGQSKP